jgi:hypothetical protein
MYLFKNIYSIALHGSKLMKHPLCHRKNCLPH